MRVRGLTPEGKESPAGAPVMMPYEPVSTRRVRPEGPLSLEAALTVDEDLASARTGLTQLKSAAVGEVVVPTKARKKPLHKLSLREADVTKVVPHRVTCVRFHPIPTLCAVMGDKKGNLGLWFPDDDRTVCFSPHAGPIAEVSTHPLALNTIITGSYDGSVRSFDLERETFDELLVMDGLITSVAATQNPCVVLAGDSTGDLHVVDSRAKKAASPKSLHSSRINCLHVDPMTDTFVVSSSRDQSAAVWDLRNLQAKKKGGLTSLQTIQHTKSVTSTYFSPDGGSLLSTSLDNTVKVSKLQTGKKGKKAAPLKRISHNNHTGRWLSNFRAVWDPRDASRFVIGAMTTRNLEVYDSSTGAVVGRLQSEFMTAVPTLNAIHPLSDTIVATTASGRAALWY